MKKRVYGRKLSRAYKARKALVRALVRALVKYGSIETTKPKAKMIQGQIDKYINLAKKQTIASRRRLYGLLGNDRKTTDAIINLIKEYFKKRTGGYTRIISLPQRRGDAAEIAKIEWVENTKVDNKGGTSKTSRGKREGINKKFSKETKRKSAKSKKKSV